MAPAERVRDLRPGQTGKTKFDDLPLPFWELR
jgi:hypothetical protein